MSKQEIRLGQQWTEKTDSPRRRTMEVDAEVSRRKHSYFMNRDTVRYRLRLISGVGNATTEIKDDILRSGWILTKEAPDSPPRSIVLPVAPATATHCGEGWTHAGRCRALIVGRPGDPICCGAYDQPMVIIEGKIPRRLPECIAAEVRNE